MKLVFMGSGDFALPSLEHLLDSKRHEVAALVTQPDRPAGRGHRLRPPPTKELASARGVPVEQPPKVRAPEAVDALREIAPDCIVVVAYGQIIPKAILDLPPKGIVNVHGSLLPAYRGAAPIQWAIARCETKTGVTTMLMDEGLDTGPVLLRSSMSIEPEDTAGTLAPRLAAAGAELLEETLVRWERGALTPEPQDDSRATLAPRIKKEDARIDWTAASAEIACRVRGFFPWPVAFTHLGATELRILQARAAEGSRPNEPGAIASLEPSGFVVACGGGSALLVEEVQAPGKARIPAADFARGRRLTPGARLGAPA